MSKYLRYDALKLLSYIMTVCPASHIIYLVQETQLIPIVFGLLMTPIEQPHNSKKSKVLLKTLTIEE
jgi:hypothetical protein